MDEFEVEVEVEDREPILDARIRWSDPEPDPGDIAEYIDWLRDVEW